MDVPARFPVSINGRPYQLVVGPDYQRGSPTSQRATMDTSPRASGGSIATGIAWRRSQQNWAGGAGQHYFDDETPGSTSDESRFWRSVGVDVWTRRELKPLRDCVKFTPDGVNYWNAKFAVLPDAGTYGELYVTSDTTGNHLRRFVLNGASAPTKSTVTGAYGHSYDITTNGTNVYAACENGIYSITTGAATILPSATATTHSFVNVCNGRLLASKTDGVLLEYSSAGATTTTFAGAPAGTSWQDACGVPKAILAAGNVGRQSTIYRITYDETSGALKVALTPATDWPYGEIIYSLLYHMGWLVIGTSRGVRLGTVDESGNVSYGPVIEDPGPVRGLAADGRYVWFTWNLAASTADTWSVYGYSAASDANHPVGTGRLDLGNFVQPLQPAYALDICETSGATHAGEYVTDVARINGHTWFVPRDLGTGDIFYEADTALTTTGWIESSLIEFGFEGSKIATDVEVRHSDDDGTISVTLVTEDGASTQLGTVGLAGEFESNSPIPAQEITSEAHRLRLDFLSGYRLAILADSPVSYWPCQDVAGTSVVDVQGLHAGTRTNITANQPGPGGEFPVAFELSSPSPLVSFGDQPEYEFAGDFTVEGWFRVAADQASSVWLAKYTPAGGGYEYSLNFDLSGCWARVWQNTGNVLDDYLGVYSTTVLAGGWHHLVMTVAGTTLTLYVDGVAVGSNSSPAGVRASGGAGILHVAGLPSVGYRVAGLAVYGYALTPQSVRAHYTALNPTSFDAAVRRWALRAVPVARTYEVIQVPLVLAEQVDAGGEQYYLDTLAEYQALVALKESRQVVVYNELGTETNVVVDEVILANVSGINQANGDNHHFNGTLLVKLWSV